MKNDTDNDLFVLQDTRSSVGDSALWWAKQGGYTSDIERAEVMTRDKAQRQHDCRETDLPWPLSALEGKGRMGVDMQYLRIPVSLDDYPPHTPCYLQVKSDYNGNDMIWLYEDNGRRGAAIDQARVVTSEQAQREMVFQKHLVGWPTSLIAPYIQRRIPLSELSTKAWEGCGIQRKVSQPTPMRTRHQCDGCGRFMSEAAFFGGPCWHCDTDNRP